jgi:hypothetical protein
LNGDALIISSDGFVELLAEVESRIEARKSATGDDSQAAPSIKRVEAA